VEVGRVRGGAKTVGLTSPSLRGTQPAGREVYLGGAAMQIWERYGH
jgi:hypothetical protein